MKALAEFILRGRVQALLVGLIGNFFPLISPATVALISMCKGAKEGTLLFLWLSLVLVLLQRVSSENSLLTAVSLASIGIMVLTATVHRIYASWQWTLLVTILVAATCAFGFGLLMGSDVTAFMVIAQEVLDAIQSKQQGVKQSLPLTEPVLLGIVALVLAVGSIMSLLLARWWQAGIYNPGGFQKEFHGFTIQTKVAVVLIAILLGGRFFPDGYQLWADLAALPLLSAGIALVHSTIKMFSLGGQWVAFLYIGLIFLGKPVTLILVILGLTDSLIDLRSRLARYKSTKS